MKIRFKTKDNLEAFKECHDIEYPLSFVMSPMRAGAPRFGKRPKGFNEYRQYEFRGEVVDGIPTVHEV
jgi:hypothetical protein